MGYVTLLLAGPGCFSVDKALFGRGGGTGWAKKTETGRPAEPQLAAPPSFDCGAAASLLLRCERRLAERGGFEPRNFPPIIREIRTTTHKGTHKFQSRQVTNYPK
jgi:hypothetical protein